MRFTCLLALLGLLITGCSKSNVVGVVAVPTQKHTWIGTYSNASTHGDVVVDLAQTGSALTGKIVFGSSGATYLPVSGTMQSDSMFLVVNPAYSPPNPAEFSLRAQVLTNGSLSGTMALASAGLNANLSCRVLPRRTIDADETHSVSSDVIAMTYDGSRLWLSTVGSDYLRVDPNGTIVDTIAIYHEPDAHWTSGVLMFDGALLWGVYPITIMDPGGAINVADLLAFTANGRAPDSVRIEHRPHGLAYDGAHSWSLRGDPAALIRYDATGAVTDSLHLAIPDASQLVFDGAHFWTIGWYLKVLFEVDTSGEVVSVCDLPGTDTGSFPAGLAVEGSHIWYAESPIGAAMLHRMTIR